MREPNTNTVVGKWALDPQDTNSLQRYGNATLEFKEQGQLIYSIHAENKEQKMFLTYQIKNKEIITNQPSAPREERTQFSVTPDGRLILIYEDHESVYIRKQE
jgi:hypothetical protein